MMAPHHAIFPRRMEYMAITPNLNLYSTVQQSLERLNINVQIYWVCEHLDIAWNKFAN